MPFFDNEPADVATTETRRARKPHRCDECYRTIAPGEGYEHTRMHFEGAWETIRECRECASLRIAVQEYEHAHGSRGIDACPPTGSVWDAAVERDLVRVIARAA